MKIAAFTMLLAAAATPSASDQPRTSRPFDLSSFDQVSLESCDNVRIVSGPKFSVVASGTAGAVSGVRAKVVDGVLHLDQVNKKCSEKSASASSEILVTLPSLRKIISKGTGSLLVDGVQAASFETSLQGTGDIYVKGLEAAQITVSSSGVGDTTLDSISGAKVVLSSTGAGDILASGRADSVGIVSSGIGDIDATELLAGHLDVRSAGMADIRAFAGKSVRKVVRGSGKVSVVGPGSMAE